MPLTTVSIAIFLKIQRKNNKKLTHSPGFAGGGTKTGVVRKSLVFLRDNFEFFVLKYKSIPKGSQRSTKGSQRLKSDLRIAGNKKCPADSGFETVSGADLNLKENRTLPNYNKSAMESTRQKKYHDLSRKRWPASSQKRSEIAGKMVSITK
jgi:hypothetical protein